jgi:hypothetical protein
MHYNGAKGERVRENKGPRVLAIPPCHTIVVVAQKDLYHNSHETFGLGKEITCEMRCGCLPPILLVFGIAVFVL